MNGEKAFVDIRKLELYCLNLDHPRGKHKARVFKSILGITMNDAAALRDEIIRKVKAIDFEEAGCDEFGSRFGAKFELHWHGKKAILCTGWIVRCHFAGKMHQ